MGRLPHAEVSMALPRRLSARNDVTQVQGQPSGGWVMTPYCLAEGYRCRVVPVFHVKRLGQAPLPVLGGGQYEPTPTTCPSGALPRS
jgi:hypothetical protein